MNLFMVGSFMAVLTVLTTSLSEGEEWLQKDDPDRPNWWPNPVVMIEYNALYPRPIQEGSGKKKPSYSKRPPGPYARHMCDRTNGCKKSLPPPIAEDFLTVYPGNDVLMEPLVGDLGTMEQRLKEANFSPRLGRSIAST